MNSSRNTYIDFLRALAIIDMILVHFSIYFPEIIEKIINYSDIAMESFLLLSGFMIGNHYLNKFISNKKETIKKLYLRVFKIFLIQYILILTISFPHHILTSDNADLGLFILNSLTFSNQVGLIHILTIFIPLFLFSPFILLLLAKNRDILLFSISFVLFISGQSGLINTIYGEQTIFPIILWQIYFVAGCILGKYSSIKKSVFPKKINKTLLISFGLILFAFIMKATPIKNIDLFDNHLTPFKISRFPLNFAGLFYSSAVCFFIYSITAKFWYLLGKFKHIDIISIFGRHSMLVFFIHVYFAKIADILTTKHLINNKMVYILIFANFIFTFFILRKYENQNKNSKSMLNMTIKSIFG